jgi:hypothetical protein
MNRRGFLIGSSATLGLRLAYSQPEQPAATTQAIPVEVHLDESQTLGQIPAGFLGLGYEISSVASGGPFETGDGVYAQLVRSLGRQGVIRIGGNTADYASFAPHGQSIATSKATVVNEQNLQSLRSFLDATGWQLIWGLDLGKSTEAEAVEEAVAVSKITGPKLLAFEIGNEPDLFSHEGHRPKGYSYDDYLREYRRYKAAVRTALPQSHFAGPDEALNGGWCSRFAADESKDIVLLTHHYYREGQNPSSSLDKLLHPDPKLAAMLTQLRTAAQTAGIPFRICETNSFSGGGRPGVSDTFGAALWALEYLCVLAWGGAAGVNMETGVNQLDFVSSYSPIADDTHRHYSAAPEYYGMLAFSHLCGGQRLSLQPLSSELNLSIYGVTSKPGQMTLALLNKEDARDATVKFHCKDRHSPATVLRLTGPSLDAKDGVTLAGAAVSAKGSWAPKKIEHTPIANGICMVSLPAASAAIIELHQ